MEIIFTKHAQKRMVERNIELESIKDTLSFPDYSIKKGEKFEVYKKINNKKLKIVYCNTGKFIKIITLIWK